MDRILHWLLGGHVWETAGLTTYGETVDALYQAHEFRCAVCGETKTEMLELDIETPAASEELGIGVDLA